MRTPPSPLDVLAELRRTLNLDESCGVRHVLVSALSSLAAGRAAESKAAACEREARRWAMEARTYRRIVLECQRAAGCHAGKDWLGVTPVKQHITRLETIVHVARTFLDEEGEYLKMVFFFGAGGSRGLALIKALKEAIKAAGMSQQEGATPQKARSR